VSEESHRATKVQLPSLSLAFELLYLIRDTLGSPKQFLAQIAKTLIGVEQMGVQGLEFSLTYRPRRLLLVVFQFLYSLNSKFGLVYELAPWLSTL